MPRVRVHQHVNPLAPYYRQTPEPLRLDATFDDPARPLHVDLGCARGRFILRMAEAQPEWNFLGIEIREPLVDEANRIASESNLANLRYVFCNAMISLDKLLADIPADRIKMVTIQFPDPWFKKKHAKRRMVNADLVSVIAKRIAADGRVFVTTDIEPLFEEMAETFRANDAFVETSVPELLFEFKTERQTAVEAKDLPVYRTMFEMKSGRSG